MPRPENTGFRDYRACPEALMKKEAKEIQKALTIYDSMFQTGNQILDTILTEKKTVTAKYNKN